MAPFTNTPRLCQNPRSGVILGFLRDWVSSKDSLKDLEQNGFTGFPLGPDQPATVPADRPLI